MWHFARVCRYCRFLRHCEPGAAEGSCEGGLSPRGLWGPRVPPDVPNHPGAGHGAAKGQREAGRTLPGTPLPSLLGCSPLPSPGRAPLHPAQPFQCCQGSLELPGCPCGCPGSGAVVVSCTSVRSCWTGSGSASGAVNHPGACSSAASPSCTEVAEEVWSLWSQICKNDN